MIYRTTVGAADLKGVRPVPPAPSRDHLDWCTDWLAKIADESFQSEQGGRREEGRGREEGGGKEEGTGRREGRGRDSWVLLGVQGGSFGPCVLGLG